MRIIGVDPGITRLGIGVVESHPARKVELVHVEVLRTTPQTPAPRRLLQIFNGITEAVKQFQPQYMAVERVFAEDNVRSVMGTSQAAGIAMIVAAQHNLPVGLHSPTEAKAAVTGDGRAQKLQVQKMVTRILQLEKLVRPADAADALALAICHAWRGGGAGAAMRAQYGGADTLPSVSSSGLTPAQRLWAEAERASRRAGAVSSQNKR